MKHELTIEYGDEILAGLGLSPEEFSREARFLLAAKLYELGRLSSGQAAKLSDLERVDFLVALGRIGVAASNLDEDEAAFEIEFGKR
jgi:predicted HTH domain antitoxin